MLQWKNYLVNVVKLPLKNVPAFIGRKIYWQVLLYENETNQIIFGKCTCITCLFVLQVKNSIIKQGINFCLAGVWKKQTIVCV